MQRSLRNYVTEGLRRAGALDYAKHVALSAQETVGLDNPLNIYHDLNFDMRRILLRSGRLVSDLSQGNGPKVVFMVPRGLHYDTALQTFLAYRLMYDGAQCFFFLCEELPQCLNRDIYDPRPDICGGCLATNIDALEAAGLPYHRLSEYVSQADRQAAWEQVAGLDLEECRRFQWQGWDLGRFMRLSVARYFWRDQLPDEPQYLQIYRQFLYGAILLTQGYSGLFANLQPDVLVMPNGRIFWYRVACEMAEAQGVRFVTYEDLTTGFVGRTWMFQAQRPVMYLDFRERWNEWKDVPLTSSQQAKLDEFVTSREAGTLYYPDPLLDEQHITEELGLDPNRKILSLFTNIVFDSAVIEKEVGFSSMFDWLGRTIRALADQEAQLVIRVHPAEILLERETQEKVIDFLALEFPELPSNVKVVPPESPISSYSLIRLSNACLVYTTDVGWEAVLRHKPVIVAAQAHYRNKGFTYDVSNPDEYTTLLDDMDSLTSPTANQIELAQRYAYMFFFRSPIQLDLFQCPEPHKVTAYNVRKLQDLAPGRIRNLDIVADGILGKGDFVLDAEL